MIYWSDPARPVLHAPLRCCRRAYGLRYWTAATSRTPAPGPLRSADFIAYALQSAFAICTFFAFISGAPYFMIEVLGRPATEYGLYFILFPAGFMLGNFVAARTTARARPSLQENTQSVR